MVSLYSSPRDVVGVGLNVGTANVSRGKRPEQSNA